MDTNELSFNSNLDSVLWGVETSLHLEKARGFVYLQKRAKSEATIGDKRFCRQKVPARLGNGRTIMLKFLEPITKVSHKNYRLTECKPLYPNLMRLSNGTGIT